MEAVDTSRHVILPPSSFRLFPYTNPRSSPLIAIDHRQEP